ncbi:F0F1 ATP synthase subunit delta [Stenoxybacter acetivorans]|uniref:F0F1 ATP synthase subunit delta n=1 Tax=Stenoxybacter acetivorans TaxID=422441 RepID=UPI00056757C4|nr:F0F1 ATP synthase subunit delta [Stenoxybacter acetivorans]
MAEFATVARPYAKALFNLAQEKNQLESWLGELKILAQVVSQPKVTALIDAPEIGYAAKADTIVSLLDNPAAGKEVKNFVYILAENKRLSVLPEVYTQYQDLALSRNHTKIATVYTAYQMNTAQFAEVVQDLEARFQTKLQATQVVEPGLIGGLKVEVGDQVLDLSIQGRLRSLYSAMMN